MAKRLDKVPIKAEMGAWNFIKEEFRNGTTMWFCYCDCERTNRWIQPSTFKNSVMCILCANEKKSAIYRAGKELVDGKEVPEKVETVAPPGQLSLASLPKEEPNKEVEDDDFLFFPVKEEEKVVKQEDKRKEVIEQEEALWISQIEHSFALRAEAIQKLKEIARKWYSIK